MMKIILFGGVLIILTILGCNKASTKNEHLQEFKSVKDINMYEDYSMHHLLDEDPNKFISFYRSHLSEAADNYRRFLFETANKIDKKEVETAIQFSEKINFDILRNTLNSGQYKTLAKQAKKYFDGNSVSAFIVIESFSRKLGPSGSTYSYTHLGIFDTNNGSFVLENITDYNNGNIFSIHPAKENVGKILASLSKENWTCSLMSMYIAEFGIGDVAFITSYFQGMSQLATISNLGLSYRDAKNRSAMPKSMENYWKIFFDAYELIYDSRQTNEQSYK